MCWVDNAVLFSVEPQMLNKWTCPNYFAPASLSRPCSQSVLYFRVDENFCFGIAVEFGGLRDMKICCSGGSLIRYRQKANVYK
jgi:hypothetical protein